MPDTSAAERKREELASTQQHSRKLSPVVIQKNYFEHFSKLAAWQRKNFICLFAKLTTLLPHLFNFKISFAVYADFLRLWNAAFQMRLIRFCAQSNLTTVKSIKLPSLLRGTWLLSLPSSQQTAQRAISCYPQRYIWSSIRSINGKSNNKNAKSCC